MELTFSHPAFEQEVRRRLKIFDRALTDADASSARQLDLSGFDFMDADRETLFLFSNLTALSINIGCQEASFWAHFPQMQALDWCCWGDELDFSVCSGMKALASLMVSGGDYSGMCLKGLDSLIPLPHLESLTLHEFGSVDLAPLAHMPRLRQLSLLYADSVEGIEAIGKLHHLERLSLCGLTLEQLDFLDALPAHIMLELCGIEIIGETDAVAAKWRRFPRRDICGIQVHGRYVAP